MTAHNPLGTKPFWVNVYPDTNVSEATGFHDKNSSDWWADEGRLYRLKVTPWIPHDGGPCPVPLDVKVRVRTKNGWVDWRKGGSRAGFWAPNRWLHTRNKWQRYSWSEGGFIVAYQIVE